MPLIRRYRENALSNTHPRVQRRSPHCSCDYYFNKTIGSLPPFAPFSFSKSQGLGNFPNDGFEGLVFDKNNTLYMALEKDGSGNPRIFTVDITESFWQSQTFVEAQSSEISVPSFSSGEASH